MNIHINGKAIAVANSLSLAAVLQQHDFDQSCGAVAVNKKFIPRRDYINLILQENDSIDIVMPMQGG